MYPDFYLQYQQSLDIRARVNELTQSLANPSWEQWFPGFLRRHRAQLRKGDIDTMAFIARRRLLPMDTLRQSVPCRFLPRPLAIKHDQYRSDDHLQTTVQQQR